MKNPLHYIHKYPHRTKRLLGIDFQQFLQLLEQAELKHAERQAEVERQKIRVNAKGGGRKPLLWVAEEVCLCLFYLRHYPTFEVLGLQFGVSKNTFGKYGQPSTVNAKNHSSNEGSYTVACTFRRFLSKRLPIK